MALQEERYMRKSIKDSLCIVFAIEHYNPLGVIRSLGEYGIKPVYIAVKGKARVASSSKYIQRCHFVDSVQEGYEILMREYGQYSQQEGRLPFLFTCDDKTMEFLDKSFEELDGKFIFFHAGKNGGITKYMDRNNILQLARKHGLNTLEAWVTERGVIPDSVTYPVITKSISPNIGGWKADVHVCYSEQELREAFDKIASPTVLIQKYIEKKNELVLEGFSVDRGNQLFVAIAATYSYLLPDYYSPRHDVANFKDDFLQKALGGMLAEIGFAGILEIEFLIDQDDTLYFSEINFRNSGWSYAATRAGMPLPVLWADAMLNGSVAEDAYKEIPEGFYAMLEPVDYGKRVETGKLGLFDWIVDFRNCACPYYYNDEDKEPYQEMIRNFKALE